MTLTLDLSSELAQRLNEEAAKRGVSADELTVELLERSLPIDGRGSQAVELLQSWIDEENADEQKATGDELLKALDEDRLSDRKLFPPELQGVTW